MSDTEVAISIGTKVYKPLEDGREYFYSECAVWCNENNADFVDKGDYYEICVRTAKTLEEVKQAKLADLDFAFIQWYERDATVTSSLGFVADSDARAMMDVSGLVTTLEAQPAETRSTVAFMDHNNEPQMLTLDQMKVLQLEIIQNGQSAYAQKWALRTAIEQAQNAEAVNAIEIAFEGEDFSAAS